MSFFGRLETAIEQSGIPLLEEIFAVIPPGIPIIFVLVPVLRSRVFEDWSVDTIMLSPLSEQNLTAPFLIHLGISKMISDPQLFEQVSNSTLG